MCICETEYHFCLYEFIHYEPNQTCKMLITAPFSKCTYTNLFKAIIIDFNTMYVYEDGKKKIGITMIKNIHLNRT